jgi:O-antigen/teichoic acid export membrane protein
MGATITTSGLGYLYWTLAAREFTEENVGIASALISAMTLASVISSLGVGPSLMQILPQRRSGKEWSATLTTGLATAALAGTVFGLVTILLVPLFVHEFAILFERPVVAIALVIGVAVTSVSTVLDQTFVAERSAVYRFIRNTAFAFIKLVILLPLFLLFAGGAQAIVISWVGAAVVTTTLALLTFLPLLRRRYRPTFAGAIHQLRSMVRLLTGNYLSTLGNLAPMLLFPLIVAIRLSVAESAYFYTTWMVAGLVFTITPSVATALFAEGAHQPAQVAQLARKSISLSAKLLLPVMALFLVGGNFILAIFGPSYAAHGWSLLIVLVLASIPDGLTNIYSSILLVRRRVFFAAALTVTMAIIALTGAWILLPELGLVSAGVAWLLAQSAGSLICGADVLIAAWRAKSQGDIAALDTVMQPRMSPWNTPAIEELETVLRPTVRPWSASAIEELETIEFSTVRQGRQDVWDDLDTMWMTTQDSMQLTALQSALPKPHIEARQGRSHALERVVIGFIHLVIIVFLLVAVVFGGDTLQLQPAQDAPGAKQSGAVTPSISVPTTLQVTSISLTVTPTQWSAPCGARQTFTFRATVGVSGSSGGTIEYTWTRSDGSSRSAVADIPPSAITTLVEDTWTLPSGAPGGPERYEYLQVTAPNLLTSDRVSFTVAC